MISSFSFDVKGCKGGYAECKRCVVSEVSIFLLSAATYSVRHGAQVTDQASKRVYALCMPNSGRRSRPGSRARTTPTTAWCRTFSLKPPSSTATHKTYTTWSVPALLFLPMVARLWGALPCERAVEAAKWG